MAQDSYRRLYASDRKRLELLARYFAQHPCPLPDLAAWLARREVDIKALSR
jgi:hypothetical protein